jgi:hypothetical protein
VRTGANSLLHYDVLAVGAYMFATPFKLDFMTHTVYLLLEGVII